MKNIFLILLLFISGGLAAQTRVPFTSLTRVGTLDTSAIIPIVQDSVSGHGAPNKNYKASIGQVQALLSANIAAMPGSCSCAHGNYTPTDSNLVNLSSVTFSAAQYQRVDNMVTVWGAFLTTNAGAPQILYQFDMDLPIGSSLNQTYQLLGDVHITSGGITDAFVTGNTSGKATVNMVSGSGNASFYYVFTYAITP